MLEIYDFISNSSFGKKSRKRELKEIHDLKVSKGILESYSEPCQHLMKHFWQKMLITHLILDENWMLTTCCKAQVQFFCLGARGLKNFEHFT